MEPQIDVYGRMKLKGKSKPILCVVHGANQPVCSEQPEAWLCYHVGTGRYYVHPTEPKKYLGKDKAQAIFDFRQYVAKLRGEEPNVPYSRPLPESVKATIKELGMLGPEYDPSTDNSSLTHHTFPEVEAIKFVRDMILRDSAHAARELGIPEIAKLHTLPEPESSLLLDKLWSMYEASPDAPNRTWVRQMKTYWDEFTKATKTKTVADLTVERIMPYRDEILRKKLARKHRFGAIKTILSFGLTCGVDQKRCEAALLACKILTKGKKKQSVNDPQPISPEHFKELLKAADTKYRAILLISLNAALYPSEVASVLKSNIDLKKKTLMMDRGKTGQPRIAVLWSVTVDSIKAYQKETPNKSDALFITSDGNPYVDGKNISQAFGDLRATLESVPFEVKFAHIRDGAITSSVSSGAKDAMVQSLLVAGHKAPGVADAYIKRNPNMVVDACKAIGKHYGFK